MTIDELEQNLAQQSAALRDALPENSLRAIYDRFDRAREAYGLGKPADAKPGDVASLLHIVQMRIDWFDAPLHLTSIRSSWIPFGLTPAKADAVWKYGTHQEQRELLRNIKLLIERVYKAIRNSIQEQWIEANRFGRQNELIEKWKLRMLQRPVYASSAGVSQEEAEDTAPPAQAAQRTSVKTWVAFQLVDENGNPVPDEPYRVTLPDGSIRSGRLDSQGLTRFDNIDPGECQFTLTRIDAREWQPA